MEYNIEIKLPEIWGETKFEKDSWGAMNFIVGPNGTGKSMLAKNLKSDLDKLDVRFLNAERLAGLEEEDQYRGFTSRSPLHRGIDISNFDTIRRYGKKYGLSGDAFVILKEQLDVRIKIEALLSDIFNKKIRLVEEGGYLTPKMSDIEGSEYDLKENECHGLKELISLLTFLYDDNNNCLIIDEPELHLHPQFQSFFMQEVRKIAGNPLIDSNKKCFFFITHSPYFVDIKTIEELKNLIVCHYDREPTYINNLSEQDQWCLKKFLPRFNVHHKQFVFSQNPVFVEGYTDQQIISILLERLDKNIEATGSCIIDVGGKNELEVFFRLCNKLDINGRFIADLDSVFSGKLRQTVAEDERSQDFAQKNGLDNDIMSVTGKIQKRLKDIYDELKDKGSEESDINFVVEELKKVLI